MQHPPDITRATFEEIQDGPVLFAEIVPSPLLEFAE
jgi:hypothetical protein